MTADRPQAEIASAYRKEGEKYILTCRLKIRKPIKSAVHTALKDLKRVSGMKEVHLIPDSGQLYIAFDAMDTCLSCVEDVFEQYGISLYQGWLQYLRSEYIRLRYREEFASAKRTLCGQHGVAPSRLDEYEILIN